MKRTFAVARSIALLILIALALPGCGLFNSAAREREEQNQAVQQGAVLGEIVTAEGVAGNNQPVNETNTFSASQDFIYAVVEAQRVEPGTALFARWSRDGTPFEDSNEIKADRLYENTYVEFHLENLQDSMEPGNYSVQIFVNGNPAKQTDFVVQK
jgi:hypothetical protein